MKLFALPVWSLLFLTGQLSSAVRHHKSSAAHAHAANELQPRWVNTNFPIYKPGDKFGFKPKAIATSYELDGNLPLSGACGWNNGNSFPPFNGQLRDGNLIYGAAQMYSVFGNGVSCGTCLRLNATDTKTYRNVGSFTVTVINSCPPPCVSLDLEVPGIVHWLKRPRVGQLDIVGEVVPCEFKKNGIFIEVFQFTSTIYDARFNVRGNSGAIALLQVACEGTRNFWHLKKENPLQYTLADGNQHSPEILKCKWLHFRVWNFAGELVYLPWVPNKLYQREKANEWHKTKSNFIRT